MSGVWPVVAAGALVGTGLTVTAAGLWPAAPDLRATLDRLLPSDLSHPTAARPPKRGAAVHARALPPVVDAFGLARFRTDLRILGLTPLDLAAKKLTLAGVGLAFPTLLSALLLLAGIQLPFAVPAVASLVLAGMLFWVPDLQVRRDSAAARTATRYATCTYLELVAMERIADAGVSEALDRAAAIATTPPFARIADALLRAELSGRPSWDGLRDLSTQTGVVELGDLADIVAVAGHDGAAIYTTLRARAASLRTQLLTQATATANAASEHMVVPVSLLGLCFMALLGYPAFVRILGT
ncbi:type II secretion system F family protein [Cellulomonas endophytica]|uniref:type II secretion system F family protein n=1 Tax=Cellulomonas endophytica TaxID=2494735 RepID=UPI00101212DA|nr:type II secretion system F family protein [Cellulomonas endophytica]